MCPLCPHVPTDTSIPPAVLLMIGLAVFANILSNMELSHSVTAGWSFYIAWLALLIAFSGAIYFGGVTIYSYK